MVGRKKYPSKYSWAKIRQSGTYIGGVFHSQMFDKKKIHQEIHSKHPRLISKAPKYGTKAFENWVVRHFPDILYMINLRLSDGEIMRNLHKNCHKYKLEVPRLHTLKEIARKNKSNF